MRFYVERGRESEGEWVRDYDYETAPFDAPDAGSAKAQVELEHRKGAFPALTPGDILRLWCADGFEGFYEVDQVGNGAWILMTGPVSTTLPRVKRRGPE